VVDVMLDVRMIRNSGIGTYLRGLLSGFDRHSFFENHSLGLAVNTHEEFNGRKKTFRFHSPIYSLQEQLEYPFRSKGCRLWHAPHYNAPVVKNSRLVVTIHDLIHWIFRGKFYSNFQGLYAKLFIQNAIRNADRIITVSKKTRDDLIENFQAPMEKIRVIYEGVSPHFFNPPEENQRKEVLRKYGLPQEFYLYVGLIKPHKNVQRLIEVYQKLRREGRLKASLLLVGKKDSRYPAGFEKLKGLKTGDGIYYLPGIDSQDELHCLYYSAKGLVHPSLYEGFGLTVLEAMASGIPTIVSRAASLPEVAGDAAYFVDAASGEELARALVEFEQNDKLREDLGKAGKVQARKFNWEDAAQQTVDVYREVLES
jgi:glycosyltransferase involved in cell wall biosynthesis